MSQIPGNNLFFLLDHPELLNNKNCKKFFSDFFNDMENMKDLEKTKSPINEKLKDDKNSKNLESHEKRKMPQNNYPQQLNYIKTRDENNLNKIEVDIPGYKREEINIEAIIPATATESRFILITANNSTRGKKELFIKTEQIDTKSVDIKLDCGVLYISYKNFEPKKNKIKFEIK